MTSGPVVVPITPVRVASYPPGASYGPRRAGNYEFVWILRGSAVWRVGGSVDVEHVLRPGQLSLSRPGATDFYRWDPDRETVHAYVHFEISDPGPLPPEHSWPETRSLAAPPALEGLCAYLLDLGGEPGPAARLRTDRLLGVLLDLFVAGPVLRPEAALPPPVAAMVEVVRRKWRHRMCAVPVPVLATGAGVSPGHLFRIFRDEYGCSPARALEAVRLARAATLVQRSNATLAEVANRCGFANAYHFSRRFSAAYGLPPGAYRGLGEGPDPEEPIRVAGLLPIARALVRA